jgi:cytoskeletal protein CcmA (bactofilin family)
MWKKEEGQSAQGSSETETRGPAPRSSTSSSGRATIGPSISIKGDVTGSEDLLIQGRIDGSVTLDNHSVGVGSEGRVNANITGRLITIEGTVEGDLTAQEQIVLRGSAHVKGDIKAPRVVLEDGATFRGLVDMGAPKKAEDKSSAEEKTANGAASAKSGGSGSGSSGSKQSSATTGSTGSKPSGASTSGSSTSGSSTSGSSSSGPSSSGPSSRPSGDKDRSSAAGAKN